MNEPYFAAWPCDESFRKRKPAVRLSARVFRARHGSPLPVDRKATYISRGTSSEISGSDLTVDCVPLKGGFSRERAICDTGIGHWVPRWVNQFSILRRRS